MEANEMESGTRDESREALEEFQRGHEEMGGAIAIRGFELQDDLTGPAAAEPFVPESGAGDVATKLLEFLPLLGRTRRFGMQTEPLGTHTAPGLRHFWVCEAQRWIKNSYSSKELGVKYFVGQAIIG